MPEKMARSAPRRQFRLAAVPVTVGTSRLSCGKAAKREYSCQLGSHPGNLGLIRLAIHEDRLLVAIEIAKTIFLECHGPTTSINDYADY